MRRDDVVFVLMDGEAGLIQYTMAHGLTENSRKVHVNFAKESRYSAIVSR